MTYHLKITDTAKETLRSLKKSPNLEKRFKAVVKALRFLEQNPKHPGLNTHIFESLYGPKGEKMFECYAENNTPKAYRIFFYYSKTLGEITIENIIPHP